ncbi:MAG: protein kinase [Planctomycetes bacterium]|nr:protein kinase [Planctomycetota bacterium]
MNKQKDPANEQHLQDILARTVPDEEMQFASISDLIKTVEEHNANSEDQYHKVSNILLETLEDGALGEKSIDFNVHNLLETTAAELEDEEWDFEQDQLSERLNTDAVPGRYDVKGLLGSGAGGQVFAVYDNNFDRHIAVKFMHPDDAQNKKKLSRFIDEALITAELAHPNILPVHDLDYTDGALIFFSMGRADGRSLQELIQAVHNNETPPQFQQLEDRVHVILQVCNAIAYAHSQGIVHHDIKPGNIMVGPHGETIVVDWGTASTAAQRDTNNKRMLGTPIYMSPEQARREKADERSDIYCLGATLFHALTLRFPFWDSNLETFWENKCQGTYQQPSQTERKQIPHALLSITEKALQANPDERYPSVEAMALDLEAYLQGQAVSAHHDSVSEMIKRIYKKEPRVIYAAIIGLLLIVGAIGWLFYEKNLVHTPWVDAYQENFSTSNDDFFSYWNASLLSNQLDSKQAALPLAQDALDQYFTISENSLQFLKEENSDDCVNLTFIKNLPGNIRMSWDYSTLHSSKLNCFIGGDNRNQSYLFQAGHDNNQSIQLSKGNKLLLSTRLPFTLSLGQTYRFQMTKTDTFVALSINNQEIIRYFDPDILVDNTHKFLGLDFTEHGTQLDNIHIEYQPLAKKISPIAIAHLYYSKGLYTEAIEHYRIIRNAYEETEMAAMALYRMARAYGELGQNDQARLHYQQFLQIYPQHTLTEHVVLQHNIAAAVDGQ